MANDFSGDSNCKALWRLEDGALTTDSIGGNTLTNSGMAADTSHYKEGACSCEADNLSDRLYCVDGDLDAGFPLKSGDTNKKISMCGWFRASAFPSSGYRHICGKYTVAGNGRSFGVWCYKNGSDWNLCIGIGYNSGNSVEEIAHASALSASIWYHFGVTFDDSDKSYRIRIWDDNAGAILGSDKTGTAINNIYVGSIPTWNIGTFGGASNCLGGEKDEVVVFDDILTSDEIDEIRAGTYGAGSSPSASVSGSVSASPSVSVSASPSASISASASEGTPSASASFWELEASVEDSQPVELVEFHVEDTAAYYRYAAWQAAITYNGHTFAARGDLMFSKIEQGQNLLEHELTITLDWDNLFAQQYIAAPPQGLVEVIKYRGQLSAGTLVGVSPDWMGTVDMVGYKAGRRAEVRCTPASAEMLRPALGLVTGRLCGVPLFSARCGLTKATYTVSGTIDSVSGFEVTDTQFATKSDGWFAGGIFTCRGHRRKIEAHTTDTITLWPPAIPGLAAGDAYTATAGCDHSFATCSSAKFGDNHLNFRGCPNIPDRNPYGEGAVY